MNAVKKCSLSGIAFTMDPEAFAELGRYLETLRESYKDSAEGAEIIADIEARIAELILATQSEERVVEPALIRNIIAQMGSATQINDEEPRPTHSSSARNPRRLYRDSKHAKLGGVCAGLGRYFDLDPVLVRLACFLPLFLGILASTLPFLRWFSPIGGNLFGLVVVGYLVMWFAVPVARTARQKLEMTGERITADSIASVSAAANDPDGASRTVVAETVSLFGKIVLLLLKLFAGLIIFGLVLAACGLLIGLFFIAVTGHESIPASLPLSIPITGIFIGLIPVFIMIYVLMCLVASRKPNGKVLLATFLLWIATIVACCTIAFRNRHRIDAQEIISDSIDRIVDEIPADEAGRHPDFSVRIDERDLSVDDLMRRLESGEIVREVEQGLQAVPAVPETAQPAGQVAPRTEKVRAGDRKVTVTRDAERTVTAESERTAAEPAADRKQTDRKQTDRK